MAQPPLRRRDRRSHLDDEFYVPHDPYYTNGSPPSRRPRQPRVVQESPPRHKPSRRRHPSPDFYREEPLRPSRRGSPPLSRSVEPSSRSGGSSRRSRRSPPPLAPEPPRHEPRRFERDLPIRDAPRRNEYYPPTSSRGRPVSGADLDRPPRDEPRRGRRHSPEPYRRGREYYHDGDGHEPRRRPRSQAPPYRGGYDRDMSPPPRSRTHHDGTAAAAGAGAGAAAAAAGGARGGAKKNGRRSSMPATTRAAANTAKAWWQNPLIQAGGRAAFTAGAQAAMKSRKDQGPWLGPKGAKVATAALGAALVDSFISNKHPAGGDLAKGGLGEFTGHIGDFAAKRSSRSRR